MSGAALPNAFYPPGSTGGQIPAPLARPLRLFKFVLAIPTIVPLLVLMGWIFNIETAKSIAPRLVAMNPMVALAFIAATASLWIFRLGKRHPWQRWTCRVCAAIVLLIGAVRMFSYMSDIDLGLDHLLFSRRVGSSHIDPNSALNFVILGAALAILEIRKPAARRASQSLVLTAGIVALTAFIGYAYGIKPFDIVPSNVAMALNTAITFLALCWAMLLACDDHPMVGLTYSGGLGALLVRQLLPASLGVPFVLGYLALLGERHGAFGTESGVTLFVLGHTVLFFSMVWSNALSLSKIDQQRRDAVAELRRAHDDLELRVLERTEELARSNDRLRQSADQYRFLADAMPQIVWTTKPDGNNDYYNQRWQDLCVTPFEQSKERGWESAVHPDDLPQFIEKWNLCLRGGDPFEMEVRLKGATGQFRWHLARALPMRNKLGRIMQWVGTATDIEDFKHVESELRTIQKELEDRVRQRTADLEASNHALRRAGDRLRYDAMHDALTGLPNRSFFHDQVQRCIERARRRSDFRFAVLFLDLDRFKVINDSLGHAAGDRLLVTIGDRLRRCLRPTDTIAAETTDTVARLGGDEFTILLDDLKGENDAVLVAERIERALGQPIDFEGHQLYSTVSIGIVNGNANYGTAKELLRDADAAMYHAKAAGKARHVVFDAGMHAVAMERLRIESDLQNAIPNAELRLEYLPIVSLKSKKVVGFETHLCWNHPQRGLIPQSQFIPIAEETGMSGAINTWCLEQACLQLQAWKEKDFPKVSINVRLLRRHLNEPGLITKLQEILEKTSADPSKLTIELTESTIMADPEAARRTVAEIRALNVVVLMDEFGAGRSSLTCLHQFPIHGLKIDRAFVTSMCGRRDYAAVVHAIVTLAHHLNMQVTATGVETPEQVALLQKLECDAAQGHFFSDALDATSAEKLLSHPLKPLKHSA
ncbi:MAG TPA: EAL domain-containing protein [Tepidisphaeraceae bacterium]|nr:EAL domain-containing protein [Tepidisphaeraceae bacterium]